MEQYFWKLVWVDAFTWCIVLMYWAMVTWALHVLLNRAVLGFVFAPLLIFGGLAGNYLLRAGQIVPAVDKDTHVAMAAAIGVFGSVLMFATALCIVVAINHRKERRIEGMPILAPRDPDPVEE